MVGPTGGNAWSRRNLSPNWTPESLEWGSSASELITTWLASGRNLRVLGECWGMSEVSHPAHGGSVLVTRTRTRNDVPRVRWTSPQQNAVTCGLGCTFEEVHEFLAHEGGKKSLANQPGYSGLTVMGTLGTGGHGSGLSQGPLESLVRSVTLASICARSETLRFDQDHPDFPLAVHHLGRLGPVVEVELGVREAFRIAERREIRVLGQRGRDFKNELRDLIYEAALLQRQPTVHSAEIWVAPYQRKANELVVALGTRHYTTEPLSTTVKRPSTLRYEVLQAAGRALATLLACGLEHLTPWVLEQAVRSTHTPEPVVMEARTGLDFGAPNVNRMGSIEAAVALGRGADALTASLEMLARLAQQGLYVFSPLGVRFVGQARDGNLSPQSGRTETLHLEVPTLGNDRMFRGHEVLAPLQRMLAASSMGAEHSVIAQRPGTSRCSVSVRPFKVIGFRRVLGPLGSGRAGGARTGPVAPIRPSRSKLAVYSSGAAPERYGSFD